MLKTTKTTLQAANTRSRMFHWLAEGHSDSFAPAFTLSFHDSECSRKPPNAHSLGR